MKMVAIDEIAIGEDLTPPLRPIAAVLRDSALPTHCSACFSALNANAVRLVAPILPENPYHVPDDTPTPHYCSDNCTRTDDPALYLHSGEQYLLSLFPKSSVSSESDSMDLRLSLRLSCILKDLSQERSMHPIPFLGGENEGTKEADGQLERIMGLLTNREKLSSDQINKEQSEGSGNPGNSDVLDENSKFLEEIRQGAKLMARATRMCEGKDVNTDDEMDCIWEEMFLCLVTTNSVEVHDRDGRTIGLAVYDYTFSWINHSCSPNTCFRFLVGTEENDEQLLTPRIAPAAGGDIDGSPVEADKNACGPRVVIRSIKALSKDEEVTITYTDLLQPKKTRQADLWLMYRFNCNCVRCGAVPLTHVDDALESISGNNFLNGEYLDDEAEKLVEKLDIDKITSGYLKEGDAKLCCQNLEYLLCYGAFSEKSSQESKEAKSLQRVQLHPFNHSSISVYTTLASVYKVQGSDLWVLGHEYEALNMHKTSSAYALLLAGVANCLLVFEPAIVPTAAEFWKNAGQSLLNFYYNGFRKDELTFELEMSFLQTLKCDDCSFVVGLDTNSEETKSLLCNCISKMVPKVWSLLSSENKFLKSIQNPVDFSWIESPEAAATTLEVSCENLEINTDEVRMDLILLGIHCLRYGALLSNICYGFAVETNFRRDLEAALQRWEIRRCLSLFP